MLRVKCCIQAYIKLPSCIWLTIPSCRQATRSQNSNSRLSSGSRQHMQSIILSGSKLVSHDFSDMAHLLSEVQDCRGCFEPIDKGTVHKIWDDLTISLNCTLDEIVSQKEKRRQRLQGVQGRCAMKSNTVFSASSVGGAAPPTTTIRRDRVELKDQSALGIAGSQLCASVNRFDRPTKVLMVARGAPAIC